jgi:uncharacterized membrane protein
MATEDVTSLDDGRIEEAPEAETSTGLDENIAGALSYVLGFITGIVFFVLEPENEFVRFHAAQSMVLSVGVVILSIGLSILSAMLSVLFIGDLFATGGILTGLLSLVLGLVSLVLSAGVFVLWLYLIVRAYQGRTPRVPVVAGVADRLV